MASPTPPAPDDPRGQTADLDDTEAAAPAEEDPSSPSAADALTEIGLEAVRRAEAVAAELRATPRVPSPDEVADLHPATDLFVAFLDAVSEYALGRPLRPRLKVSPAGLMRGEVDVIKIELPAFSVAGLVLDRFVIRAERVRVMPGLPPTLVAEPVGLRAVVSQANVDRWTSDIHLPIRLRLTEDGVVTSTGLAGFRVTEVTTMPDVAGGFLRLRPTRASLFGVPAPMVSFIRGYLPLPPLPRNAKLEAVDPSDGELTLTFRIDRFEQKLTPDVRKRVTQLLNLPLPGLR